MRAIRRYVRWKGHDAGGTLAPQDVAAGLLDTSVWRLPEGWPTLAAEEALVLVPPQWIGGWEDGHPLAPGYQHIWRAPLSQLSSPPDPPLYVSYRPAELPASATGPARRSAWPRKRSR